MIVRPANLSYLKTIQDLNHDLFKHDSAWISHLAMDWPYDSKTGAAYFNDAIEKLDTACFVAEENGEIVGYLAGALKEPESYRNVKRAELENMFVKESYRHQGIGKLLAAKFKEWCKEQGAQKILAIASAPNESAIQFYKSIGFESYSLELEMDLEKSDNND